MDEADPAEPAAPPSASETASRRATGLARRPVRGRAPTVRGPGGPPIPAGPRQPDRASPGTPDKAVRSLLATQTVRRPAEPDADGKTQARRSPSARAEDRFGNTTTRASSALDDVHASCASDAMLTPCLGIARVVRTVVETLGPRPLRQRAGTSRTRLLVAQGRSEVRPGRAAHLGGRRG
jgi:hypothetical protein